MSEEDLLAKYKRLLALARNSLEANQNSLAAKDKQIGQLSSALEEEKEKALHARNKLRRTDQEENANFPKSLIRRVDVSNQIWVLLEYEGSPDNWMSFINEDDLDDYIQRIPGAPLSKPHRCLTEAESSKIENESRLKVERIVEEFRRYKVKVEISKKQHDSDPKQQLMSPSTSTTEHSLIHDSTPESNEYENELIKGYRKAYERVTRENEQLRTQSGDSMLLKKWQERYEEIMKEKEDLVSKLKIFTRSNESNIVLNNKFNTNNHNHVNSPSSSNGVSNKKTLEQSYIELKDEYKVRDFFGIDCHYYYH